MQVGRDDRISTADTVEANRERCGLAKVRRDAWRAARWAQTDEKLIVISLILIVREEIYVGKGQVMIERVKYDTKSR